MRTLVTGLTAAAGISLPAAAPGAIPHPSRLDVELSGTFRAHAGHDD